MMSCHLYLDIDGVWNLFDLETISIVAEMQTQKIILSIIKKYVGLSNEDQHVDYGVYIGR